MPIIKRIFNKPAPYLPKLDLANPAEQRTHIRIYARCIHRAVLTWLVMGTAIVLAGNISADTDTSTDSHQKMLTLLKQIAAQTAETNNYIGEGMARQLRRHIANLPVDAFRSGPLASSCRVR